MSSLAHPTSITLTTDQQNALTAFEAFLDDPDEKAFVLRGYSGCGKSTLVNVLIDCIIKYDKMAQLVQPSYEPRNVELTATTNKAAENLFQITQTPACTIHSFLNLRVITDPRSGKTQLSAKQARQRSNYLIFIDEASYIDSYLLKIIFDLTPNSKLVFIGDPAQLIPVGSKNAVVFASPFTGAALTSVVRQAANNPIINLSTRFRDTVNSGKFFSFTPDNNHIQHLSQSAFEQAVIAEFSRPDWKFNDSKILAWTNNRVVEYNRMINQHVRGDPHFLVGDYAICNQYIGNGRTAIKTDQLVQITTIEPDTDRFDVPGNIVLVNNNFTAFQPKSRQDKVARLKKAQKDKQFPVIAEIETGWFDLRAAYACTVNKAQGSTFDRVFIDLNDIARCRNADQLARMLYVAVSRARHQVIMTGDLV